MIVVKVLINGVEAGSFEMTSEDMIDFSVDDSSAPLVQAFMRDCADAISTNEHDIRLH